MLEPESVASDVDLNRLARLTVNFSGSASVINCEFLLKSKQNSTNSFRMMQDLRELCRNASVYRLREYVRVNDNVATTNDNATQTKLDNPPPPISMQHLLDSFGKMKESKMHTGVLGEHRIDLD